MATPLGAPGGRLGNNVGRGDAARRRKVSKDNHHHDRSEQPPQAARSVGSCRPPRARRLVRHAPGEAAWELPGLEELVVAASEAEHAPAAALMGMAILVTDTTIRLADPTTLDPVTGRLDRAVAEGYLAALDLWVGPPLDNVDRESVMRTRDMFGNEVGRAHMIER